MFRTKICGVTSRGDAGRVARSGADAIGLNFYAPSPRSVSVDQAVAIAASLRESSDQDAATGQPAKPLLIGVFVNASLETIQMTVRSVGLSAVQLHGDETVELVAALKPLPVLRAFRMSPGDAPAILNYVAECAAVHPLAGVLIDAAVPGQFGGTGEKADWGEVSRLVAQLRSDPGEHPRLILAGGLTAENVSTAIAQANPDGVDTASGVEESPGVKNADSVAAFVDSAHSTFAG